MFASKESLHERLRAATRPLHDDLEQAVRIEERIHDRARYTAYLVQLWRLHSSAETAFQGLDFSPVGFVYPSPYRAALIEMDLAFLGLPPAALAKTSLPSVPRLTSIAAGLGCVYVVEGSAKGARAILPQIKTALGFDGNRGAAFFAGSGQEGKLLWHAFLAAIDRIEPASKDGDEVVEAAQQTFAMFKHGLVPLPEGNPASPSDRDIDPRERSRLAPQLMYFED